MMAEREVDFIMQIITHTLLSDNDHRLQVEAVALGAKPLDLCAGQLHELYVGWRQEKAHGSTAFDCARPPR